MTLSVGVESERSLFPDLLAAPLDLRIERLWP
jgi:hypothetical protein